MSPRNQFISRSRVTYKTLRRGSLHSYECWLLLVTTIQRSVVKSLIIVLTEQQKKYDKQLRNLQTEILLLFLFNKPRLLEYFSSVQSPKCKPLGFDTLFLRAVYLFCHRVKYDTIRYSKLTCAQKMTRWPT